MVVYPVPAIRLYLVDDSDTRSQVEYWIRPGSTVAQGRGAAHTMRGALSGVSGCTVYGFGVEYRAVELNLVAPNGPAPVGQVGVLIFNTTAAGEYAIVTVPGIKTALIKTSGDGAGVQLDSTAPAIAALVAQLTNGNWMNPFGYVITSLAAAMVQIRP